MNKFEAAQKLQNRTKQFAIRIIQAFSSLPKTEAARIIGQQIIVLPVGRGHSRSLSRN
jgi:hypothetical protein